MKPASEKSPKRRPGAKTTAEGAEVRKHLGKPAQGSCGTTAEELRKPSSSSTSPPSSPSCPRPPSSPWSAALAAARPAPSLGTNPAVLPRKGSPAEPTNGAGEGVPDTEFLDSLWATFLETPAPLTRAQVETIEAHAALGAGGHRTRRAALALLCKNGAELVEVVREREGRAALEDVAASLADYRKALDGLSELMEQAATRLAVALCEPVAE